jgi:hypothetical protein
MDIQVLELSSRVPHYILRLLHFVASRYSSAHRPFSSFYRSGFVGFRLKGGNHWLFRMWVYVVCDLALHLHRSLAGIENVQIYCHHIQLR